MDNGHFKIINGHLPGAECDRKLRFREEKFLYVTLFNTRHFIDNSYLVDGIVTGKLEWHQSLSHSKNELEVNCIVIEEMTLSNYCYFSMAMVVPQKL